MVQMEKTKNRWVPVRCRGTQEYRNGSDKVQRAYHTHDPRHPTLLTQLPGSMASRARRWQRKRKGWQGHNFQKIYLNYRENSLAFSKADRKKLDQLLDNFFLRFNMEQIHFFVKLTAVLCCIVEGDMVRCKMAEAIRPKKVERWTSQSWHQRGENN